MTVMAAPRAQEIVVVTGASSGIGAATARELARLGFHILAGVRREEDAAAIRGPGIEPAFIDVTNPSEIQALADRVQVDPQGRTLRALINNAGVGVNAPVEVFAMDNWRALFEVNFFGQVALTQALLPALIRCKGRVINVSSVGGRVAMATYGPYASTKFALEAVSDSLRRELYPLGVKVVVIEPAAVKTRIAAQAIAKAREVSATMTPEQRSRYHSLIEAVTAQAGAETDRGLSADEAAKVIAEAVTARKPRTRYAVGRGAALLPLFAALPDCAVDQLLTRSLRPYYSRGKRHDVGG